MSALGCPIDLQPLTRVGQSWKCPANHSYDVAREGYVNLLPPGRPSRKKAGDDKDSIDARRRFLGAGHYAPLAETVRAMTTDAQGDEVVDVGCGEGYYTSALDGREVAGIDISTPGIKAAARAYPSCSFAVGNALALPVVTESVDVAVSVFAPVAPDEFARVVRPGGSAVIAIPGNHHLEGVRDLLYATAQPHDESMPLSGDDRFALADTRRVVAEITLPTSEALDDLLTMTPYRFAVPPEAIARAKAAPTPLMTPIEFVVSRFVRN